MSGQRRPDQSKIKMKNDKKIFKKTSKAKSAKLMSD